MTTERLEQLHTALNRLCPTGEEQRKLTLVRGKADKQGCDEEVIAYRMMEYVMGGIRANHW